MKSKTKISFLQNEYRDCLLSAKHGLERETLRVDFEGNLSQTPHPRAFGSSLTHPLVKTDFAEAQVEFATGIHKSIPDAISELEELHRFTAGKLGQELFWPFSMPAKLPSENHILVGQYGTSEEGRKKTIYRNGLSHRYGKKMQTISGVHYNVSFDTCLLSLLSEKRYKKPLSKFTKSSLYFDTIRNFYRYSPALFYLFGSSSLVDESFLSDTKSFVPVAPNTYQSPFATTLRLSDIGYTSQIQSKFPISLNSLTEYVHQMCSLVTTSFPKYSAYNSIPESQLNDFVLQLENEYYSLVRPKQVPLGKERVVDALSERGVEYLEIRLLDLFPFSPIGVDENSLYFIHLLLLYCLLIDSPKISSKEQTMFRKNQKAMSWMGRKPSTKITFRDKAWKVRDFVYYLLDELLPLADLLDGNDANGKYSKAWELQWEKWDDPTLLPSAMTELDLHIHKVSFVDFGLQLGNLHKQSLLRDPLPKRRNKYYEDMAEQSFFEQKKKESWEASSLPVLSVMPETSSLCIGKGK